MTCLLALKTAPAPLPQGSCIGCGGVCVPATLDCCRMKSSGVWKICTMNASLPSIRRAATGCGACSYVCPAGRDVAVRVQEAASTNGTIFFEWGDDDDA